MIFAKKKIKSDDEWFKNEIKRYNLAYTSYKNVKATAERKPPTVMGLNWWNRWD